MRISPHTPYVQAVAEALAALELPQPDAVTLHTAQAAYREVHTAELMWTRPSAHWPTQLRVGWHSGYGWYATSGRAVHHRARLHTMLAGDPGEVADTIRHLITYGPASRLTTIGLGLWEHSEALTGERLADELDAYL
ncbi:hypothetical protein [Streptomyces xiamenensis]|uniref:hypothetical protein n=1 Tax=Streptomyces xiamenensis TaxID=408015 RepID=UPI0037CDB579